MPYAVDLAEDFLTVDNLVAVTVRPAENPNPELLTNGGFDTSLTGWDDYAGSASAADGLCLLTASSAIDQPVSTTVGQEYVVELSVWPKGTVTTTLAARTAASGAGSVLASATATTAGRVRLTFTATGTTTYIAVSTGSGAAVLVDDATCRLAADVEVDHALRRDITTREALASGGRYRAGDVAWHLPESEVPTVPKPAGTIIDTGGTTWTILEVGHHTWDTRWRCACRNLAVAEDLNTLITIQRANFSKGESGAQEATWATYYANVRAKIQRLGAVVGLENDRRTTTEAVEIYCEENLPLVDDRFRVIGPDGTIYRVTGTIRAELIGELFTIQAERNPWPLP